MKINEVTQPLHTYRASVKVVLPDKAVRATTSIGADSLAQARSLLIRIYGPGNVFGVSEIVRETIADQAAKSPKKRAEPGLSHPKGIAQNAFSPVAVSEEPISPQQAQTKALTDRAKKLNQQAKQMRAQQSLATAQQNVSQASQLR